MLIEAGGSSGFSRGALKLGPRKAWAFAALGEASHLYARAPIAVPLQFGQATRVEGDNMDNPITGVTRRRLSDDLYFEYFRVVAQPLPDRRLLGLQPAGGIKSIVVDPPVWSGAYVNLIANY